MTLADLLKLIKRYLGLCIIIVLACTLVGGAFGFVKSDRAKAEVAAEVDAESDQFMAQATLLVSSQVAGVGGVAKAQANVWNQQHNERYGEWLVLENQRMQDQLNASTNTSSKKSIETAPGSWLKADFSKEFKDLTIVETQTLTTSNTVIVAAIGPDPSLCIEASNTVAENAEKIAHDLYDGNAKDNGSAILNLDQSSTITILDDRINIDLIKATITTPAYAMADGDVLLTGTNASKTTSSSKSDSASSMSTMLKYGAVGFAGGIFLALIIIVLIDMARKPIKNAEELSESLEVPLLIRPNSQDNADMIFANIKLAAGKDASSISIAAVHDPTSSISVLNKLERDGHHDNPSFANVGPISTSGEAVQKISESDGVVLCMREWKDRQPELEASLNEIAIADARLIGIAVLGEK